MLLELFQESVTMMEKNKLLDIIRHPNTEQYPHQRIFIIEIDGYAYLIPFVESEEEIFLKTIIPSRKATVERKGAIEAFLLVFVC